MMGQEQSPAASRPAPEFSLIDAGRQLPTTGQVVGRAAWGAVVLVALVLLAVVVATYLTAVPTWWWLLSVLAALLLALVLLKVIRVPRPRLRHRSRRAWLAPLVRNAVARDRLPDDEARRKGAGAGACQDLEDFVLVIAFYLAWAATMTLWPAGYTWGPMIVLLVVSGVIFGPGAVRATKYLDLYHRER